MAQTTPIERAELRIRSAEANLEKAKQRIAAAKIYMRETKAKVKAAAKASAGPKKRAAKTSKS
jgi:hypothetical protein